MTTPESWSGNLIGDDEDLVGENIVDDELTTQDIADNETRRELFVLSDVELRTRGNETIDGLGIAETIQRIAGDSDAVHQHEQIARLPSEVRLLLEEIGWRDYQAEQGL